MVQSCWIDRDLDFIANMSIIDNKEVVHHQHILISGQTITYPQFSAYKKIGGKQMMHDEFNAFLNDNLQEVLSLIISLLDPGELALLAKATNKQCQLQLL